MAHDPPPRHPCPTARPCPLTGCRFHLAEHLQRRRADQRPRDESESCALDVAEQGEHTLEDIGELLGLTRERIRQIEAGALAKMAARLGSLLRR